MTVSHRPDTATPTPRRLKFSQPDPEPRSSSRARRPPRDPSKPKGPSPEEAQAAAKIARAARGERFKVPPWERPRLPHGARFELDYDAEAIRWSGTLTAGGITVAGDSGSVMNLMSALDEKYRFKAASVASASRGGTPAPSDTSDPEVR